MSSEKNVSQKLRYYGLKIVIASRYLLSDGKVYPCLQGATLFYDFPAGVLLPQAGCVLICSDKNETGATNYKKGSKKKDSKSSQNITKQVVVKNELEILFAKQEAMKKELEILSTKKDVVKKELEVAQHLWDENNLMRQLIQQKLQFIKIGYFCLSKFWLDLTVKFWLELRSYKNLGLHFEPEPGKFMKNNLQ
ncbi:hypothetical protein C1645_803687 [Glomus cerebriforme]|uniref:Uncharacterized protein n=1 Tax=Glomus cerebriforme TaxID=658196 RepID=A0A397T767_9GLOM|nr:hypothetical protein C1645_803687 [Glomus cerebriforme]